MKDSYKILAVNDDAGQLELMETILRRAGYAVLTAASGKEGCEIARSELPDLIISDVVMPGSDGIDLCRRVRADNKLRPIPIMLVSGARKDTASVVEAMKAGADDYIQIPYDSVHLIARAARLIERRRLEEKALLESENRFRSFIENSTDIISVLAPDGTIIYESPSLENVLGYQPEELIGKNAFEHIHPEDFQRLKTYFSDALQKPEPSQAIRYRFLHRDGSWRIMESVGKHFNDPFDGLVAIVNSRDITEQQQALEALRRSEEKFKDQYKSIPIPTCTWKRTGNDFVLVDYNDATEQITRGGIAGYLGTGAGELYADTPEIIEDFNRCFNEQTTIRRQLTYCLKTTGEIKHLDNSYVFIAPDIVMVHSRDMTEQVVAEKSLRMSEERFRLASLATQDALWDWDLVNNSLWLSDAFYDLLGYQSGEVETCINLWYGVLHPDDRERIVTRIHEVIESGEHFWADEYRMRIADGSYAYIFDRGYIVRDDQGKPLRMIGAAINFTERKQAEQRIRQQLDFINAVTETMAEGICTFDLEGRVTFINPAAEEILGWTREEILGRDFHQIIHYRKDDASAFSGEECRLLSVIKTGEPLRAYEDSFLRKDGTVFRAHCSSVALTAGGKITGAVQTFHDITERNRAQAQLDQFFKVSIDMLCIVGFDGYFKRINPAFEKALGYTEKELLSKPLIEFIHPDERERTIREWRKNLTGKQTIAFENRYLCKDGSIKWLLWNSATLMSEQMIYAVAHDITERKKTEEAIRFQAHLLDTVEQAIIATDLKGIVTYWNEFAQKLYGWTSAEAVGRNITELTTPKISRKQAADILALLGAGKSWSGEFTVRNKKNRTFPAYVCDSPVSDADGKLIGIVGISIDITERKKAEKALADANQRAIREYDRLLKRLTKLAQTAGAARDLLTIFRAILEFTQATVPCTGFFISLYNPEKRLRTPAYAWDAAGKEFDVSALPPMEMSGSPHSRAVATGAVVIENDFQKAVAGQPVFNISLEKDPDLPQSCLVTPMAFMGRIVGGVEVQSTQPAAYSQEHATAMQMAANLAANAIENVKLLEQERESAEQLRQSQKLESVGRLAGGIAHDFNNMLTAINGYSDLTLRRLKEDDPLRRNIEEIRKAGERSAALTHQLLAFSRKQVLKPKVLDINEVIIDTSKLLQRLIGEDVQLSIVTNPKAGRVEVDPGQLTQVIMNLAVNARDAMPHGGNLVIETANVYLDEEFAVQHYPTRPGSYVALAVTDNGIGIEETAQQHIFEPFYTTKEVGKGTGLGLATVYGIVKQSGGYIWVNSEAGKGASFKIYFPRIAEETAPEAQDGESEYIPGGSETVLLVEDEDSVRNLARQILESCGYRVIEARDGIEALSLFRNSEERIDLLLTDVVMPGMGGRELGEKIAELNPQIRQLFMSGYTDDATIRQGMIVEDINFIQKPFTFEMLAQKVRQALDAKN